METVKRTGRHAGTKTDKHTDTDRQTDEHTDGQTEIETHKLVYVFICVTAAADVEIQIETCKRSGRQTDR